MTSYDVVSIKTINPNTLPITVMRFGFIALGRGYKKDILGSFAYEFGLLQKMKSLLMQG